MLLWKVIWFDGKTNRVWAESRHQILTQIYVGQAHLIKQVVAEVRNVCDDRTNPWALAGLPGHRGEAPNPRGLAVKRPQVANRLRNRV